MNSDRKKSVSFCRAPGGGGGFRFCLLGYSLCLSLVTPVSIPVTLAKKQDVL